MSFTCSSLAIDEEGPVESIKNALDKRLSTVGEDFALLGLSAEDSIESELLYGLFWYSQLNDLRLGLVREGALPLGGGCHIARE